MPSARPNILLITTDQQRFDTIHAAGNPHIRTPHLNWLLDNGVHFRRAYSDCPICVPARATLMTGRPGYVQGLTVNNYDVQPIASATSLPGVLTRAGYQTRAQGKMHFYRRRHYGFEHVEEVDEYYRTMARHPHLGAPAAHGLGQNEMEPAVAGVADSHSLTDWTVLRSIDFLETRDDSRPFFLWTSFVKPHPPFDPAPSFWQMYRDAEAPAPARGDWSQDAGKMPQGFLLWSWKINGCDRFDAHTVRDIRRAYYACITQIDYALGRLFARLRELNLLDNTMIIFTSDHGEMLGDHHMGGKSVFFEGSAHVPMLVVPASAQGREALRGTTCDALVTLADLYPTCLAAAGVRRAADGHNLLRTARGRVPRKAVLGVCGDGDFALVAGQYKYVYCARGGAELLFDLGEDPYEQRDLIAARSHVRVHTDLRRELVRRLRTVHPPVLRNGDLPRVPVPAAREMRNRWPGFVSFCRPHDVLH